MTVSDRHPMEAPGLAVYAAQATNSLGRQYPEEPPSYRSEFQRDRDRIIHCAAFRRLEYKTQVFVNHEGDLFRTRLTHSLEVAQIARTISRTLGLNEDLTEAIALAHDLGHTPFGHAGQDALNECMLDYGGFEHNLQSLRVVDTLEQRYAEFPGLNLTFETREGVLKRCAQRHIDRLGMIGRRFREGTQPSLEAQLTNLADEIAYNSHDLDDGLRAGLITTAQLQNIALMGELFAEVQVRYPGLNERSTIYEVVRRLIRLQVADLVENSRRRIKAHAPETIEAVRRHEHPLIAFSDPMQQRHRALKSFLFDNLYQHYRVHRMAQKAQRVVRELFDAFFSDIRLLPPQARHRAENRQAELGERARARAVADYIAGMTDRFALLEHERIYHPKRLT